MCQFDYDGSDEDREATPEEIARWNEAQRKADLLVNGGKETGMNLYFFKPIKSPHGCWLVRAANEKFAWEIFVTEARFASAEAGKLCYEIVRIISSEDDFQGAIGYIS